MPSEFERLMCEVEFWEVFKERTKVFKVVPYPSPLVGCRLADLEKHMGHPFGVSHRAGKIE
jgi:hypothetical protein